MENFLGWLGYVSATFVGTGSALVALRFLSNTIFGHWLAKGLVKYTAQIETSEFRKRIVAERRDNDRNQAITQIMAAATDHAMLFAFSPRPSISGTDAPETVFMHRYRELCEAAQALTNCALKMAYLFEAEEELIPCCLEWAREAQENANRYYDALGDTVDEQHWRLPLAERMQRLIRAHTVLHLSSHPSHEKLVQLCRRIAADT